MFTIRFTALTASQMLSVVVAWQLYDLTGSALHLGLIGLVQLVPSLALTLFAGQIADRHDRRQILRIAFAVAALVPLGFVALVSLPEPPLVMFYVLLFLHALARTFESPSLQALLPTMVPRPLVSRAIALSTSAQKFSVLFGPSLGGVIYLAGSRPPISPRLPCSSLRPGRPLPFRSRNTESRKPKMRRLAQWGRA